MAAPVAVADSPDTQLAWEAGQRPRAALAAIVGALLTFLAALWSTIIFANPPRSGFLEALQKAERPGPVGSLHSGLDAGYSFYHDKLGAVLVTTVLTALGLLAIGWAMSFLAAAVRARRPELPRVATYLPIVGAVLQAVSLLASTIARAHNVSGFLDSGRTVNDAADVFTGGSLFLTAQFVGLVGQFALAAAFVLICLNAMRTGLLTRFMGVVGIISGVLYIFPVGPLPIVQIFWVFALGLLLSGRWPGAGVPPAWRTGRAEPWPTAQPPARGRGGRGPAPATASEPAAEEASAPDERPSMTGAARRKRKRRS
jgi:hypothetical protein